MAETEPDVKVECDLFSKEVVQHSHCEARGQDSSSQSLSSPACLHVLAVLCHTCSDRLHCSVAAA